ncbi:MAG TPA: trehalose-phosphatase [Actinomycetota bacterium]|nr:trehalose-phosphatase [Actinomycetota bacterium]
MGPERRVVISTQRFDAVIFDMDGVVTDTATVHAEAWARLFDRYLQDRAAATGETLRPFGYDDYRRFIDGKPRYDGVRNFLATRGIKIPEGVASDPPDRETVCGLGNRKDGYFLEHLREHGVEAFPTTVELIEELREAGIGTAVISASRNLDEVLAAGHVEHLFDQRVGGVEAERLELDGKPDPAVFLEAARRLGVRPLRAVVVEDALAGVEAGRRGRFGLVVGVDRSDHGTELLDAGADVVVRDLAEVVVATEPEVGVRGLPNALDRRDEIGRRLRGAKIAIFLDYDGTLTPIVERPEDAHLSEEARRTVERLASAYPVAVISGRDLSDVRRMVGVADIVCAGSHGFDIAGPGRIAEQRGVEFLPDLDRAEEELRSLLARIPGARLERKRFAIAIHVRQVRDPQAPEVERIVDRIALANPRLRKTAGKKVVELRPNVDWDKGRAVLWLMHVLGLDREGVVPIYVGDDATDEDAFRALRHRGLGVVVRGEDADRPTAADYTLGGTDEVLAFLDTLARRGTEDAANRDAAMGATD